MEQSEKLQKIIEYAHKNRPDLIQEGCIDSAFDDNKEWMKVIFSIDFLKAFFGESDICIRNKKYIDTEGLDEISWKNYAKRLIIICEEQRIDYLYEFIKDK